MGYLLALLVLLFGFGAAVLFFEWLDRQIEDDYENF